jgi:hypothetical protein
MIYDCLCSFHAFIETNPPLLLTLFLKALTLTYSPPPRQEDCLELAASIYDRLRDAITVWRTTGAGRDFHNYPVSRARLLQQQLELVLLFIYFSDGYVEIFTFDMSAIS